jgi:hypothetical protein
MPFPNEHSARQEDPGKYESFRRENGKFGPGIDVIWGITKDGKTEIQTIRFDSKKFTPDEAKKWLEDHNFKTEIEKAIEASLFLTYKAPPAIALARARIENGVPIRRYRKETIKAGQYIKASDNFSFEVTPETIDHWVQAFESWTAAGNKIPIPLSHADAGDPERNRGWVIGMFRDGDSLISIMDLIGDDGARLALTSDVSIFSPPEVIDGKGNKYAYPITHVALCTDPVIPGLKGFESIAASRADILIRSEDMKFEKIVEALGIKDTVTNENAEALVLAGIEANKLALAEKTAALELSNKTLKMSNESGKVDPMVLGLVAENREIKLAGLVTAGKITPAVKKILEKAYIEKPALELSLAKGVDNFDIVIQALKQNEPVRLGEETGPQTLDLSNPNNGEVKTNAIAEDVKRRRVDAGMKD